MLTTALEFPPHFSPAAADLLQNLLCADASRRLGAQNNNHLKSGRINSFRYSSETLEASLAIGSQHSSAALLISVIDLQDIDWVAGAKQDITSPHAFTHRIAYCQSP